MRNILSSFGLAVALCTAATPSAHAITNDTPTFQFVAVGELGGLSGVLVSSNWVLTAAHVVNQITTPSSLQFSTAAGSAFADSIQVYPNTSGFPAHDIALVHLSSPIAALLPTLYDKVLPNGTVRASSGISTVTMVSPQNEIPAGKALGTANRVVSTYLDPATFRNYTTNWLVVTGNSAVQTGDSGSALFKGNVNDTSGGALLGIGSAQLTEADGSPSSAYIMVANYKSWIDSTMASSGQQVQWFSAVPEPSSLALMCMALCGMLVLSPAARQRWLPQMRYRLAFAFSLDKTDGRSMVPGSHARDQESHHRETQAH